MQLLPQEHGFDQPLGLLSDCHRRVERFLKILEIVGQEAPEKSLSSPYDKELQNALNYFRDAAPKHTQDEEESLFPRINHHQQASAIIDRLEKEHALSDPLHAEVEVLGRRWHTQGHLDAPERARFRECVDLLLNLYREHIRIEDEELFPLAASLLDAPTLETIGKEMAARRNLQGVQKI